jgi:hypothetical protein
MDFRDWFVMGSMASALMAATIYIFIHPTNEGFAVWGGVITTLTGAYHWLVIKDSKQEDAPCQHS